MAGRGDVAEYCVSRMREAGAHKAQCILQDSEVHEINAESGEITLLRTTRNTSLSLTGILDDRKGFISLNKTDRESIDDAVKKVINLARSSEPDPANEISSDQAPETFAAGPEGPDLDVMYDRISSFMDYSRSEYPTLILEQVILDFTLTNRFFRNSNGVSFDARRGWYSFSPMFTSKEGADTSSFNYTGFSSYDLERELRTYGSVDTLMKQSVQQVRTDGFPGKVTGKVLITPDCLDEILSAVTSYLTDFPMITGTSIFKDSLDSSIASPCLTISSMPASEEIVTGYSFTSDGFRAENATIIDAGVLRSFLLSLYGSKKTGRRIGPNRGGAWVVEPGEKTLDEMVASMGSGILMCRFSGGNPSENGDFSGVAKNSYRIQDGRIAQPIRETMVSGNLADLLKNVLSVSKERIHFGSGVLPWILVDGLTISGK